MQKITKAIIPAAGFGTRFLPATKSQPKEMLPVVDKPTIQYIVEEAVESGIEDILIVIGRYKSSIEDHFDRSVELEMELEKKGKYDMLEQIQNIAGMANIQFVRQKTALGLGHAVYCARNFIGNEPFAILYGDDVFISDKEPVTKQLIDAYEKYGKGVVGVKEVPTKDVTKYCSLKVEEIEDKVFNCTDMIEKPKPEEIFSNYSILGRVVMPPEIFDILENTPKGAGNELQLTDAMKTLAQTKGMVGVDFTGTRYDMGNKFGILEANIEVGLNHPEIKDELRAYLKELAKTL